MGKIKSFREFVIEERVDPKAFNLTTMYRDLNRQLFNGELPEVPIAFGKTPKGAAGVTHSRATRPGNMPVWFRKTVPGSISVAISPYTYEEDALKGIVAHEMVHVWLMHFDKHERDSHGAYFKAKLSEVQRKASFKIPLSHETEDDEHGAAREVAFIAGVRSGTKLVVLLAKSFAAKADGYVRAQQSCDDWVSKRGFQWAAYGVAKSPLANTLTVARDLTRTTGAYKLDSMKLLGVQRIMYVNGSPDFS